MWWRNEGCMQCNFIFWLTVVYERALTHIHPHTHTHSLSLSLSISAGSISEVSTSTASPWRRRHCCAAKCQLNMYDCTWYNIWEDLNLQEEKRLWLLSETILSQVLNVKIKNPHTVETLRWWCSTCQHSVLSRLAPPPKFCANFLCPCG
jgi:hypothetical protein